MYERQSGEETTRYFRLTLFHPLSCRLLSRAPASALLLVKPSVYASSNPLVVLTMSACLFLTPV